MVHKTSMMNRFLMHLVTGRFAARRAFPPSALDNLQRIIAEGESTHRAQLRLVIEPALPLKEVFAATTARGRAHQLFSLYRIWDTEENCGVLIYVNLADKAVEIVTDRGVARYIGSNEWNNACSLMIECFGRDAFEAGAASGITHVNHLLKETFPLPPGDRTNNELSDRPVLL